MIKRKKTLNKYRQKWLVLFSFAMLVNLGASQDPSKTHYDILNILPNSTLSEVKKAYRSKALELHPDKLPSNLTEEEKLSYNELFMKVQFAYEILTDSTKRMEYDLELHGQFMHEQDTYFDFTKQFYQSQSFFALYSRSIFTNSNHFHFRLYMNHPLVQPPDLPLTLSIPILEVISGSQRNVSYYRRKLCPYCQGLGSLPSDCQTCHDCLGLGYNWKQKKWVDLQQMAFQKCSTCYGKGCIPISVCSYCHGKGSMLQEDWLLVYVPQAFEDNQQFVYENVGHQYSSSIEGNLVVTLNYEYPQGYWSNPDRPSELIYQYNTSLSEVIHGLTFDYTYLNNDIFEVEVPDDVPLEELLLGYDLSLPGYGLFESQLSSRETIDPLIETMENEESPKEIPRGDLIIRIKVDLNDSSLFQTLEQVVQETGLSLVKESILTLDILSQWKEINELSLDNLLVSDEFIL